MIDALFSYRAGLTSRSNDFYYRTFAPYSDQRMSKLDVSFLMQPPFVAYKRDVSLSVPQMTRLLSSLVPARVSVLDATPAITSVLSLLRGTKSFFQPWPFLILYLVKLNCTCSLSDIGEGHANWANSMCPSSCNHLFWHTSARYV